MAILQALMRLDERYSQALYHPSYQDLPFWKVLGLFTRGFGLPVFILLPLLGQLRWSEYLLIMSAASLLALFSEFVVKQVVRRQRPTYREDGNIFNLSFPSSHALATSFSLAASVHFSSNPGWVAVAGLIYILPTLALRVFKGYHFLGDILAGVVFGGGSALILILVIG